MRRFTALIAALVLAVAMGSTPASAITDGTLDGDGHPYVGLMVFQLADGRFRCSGTLISSTKFLTAGHCTSGVIGKVQIWFLADVETYRCKLTGADLTPENCAAATPNWNGYPFFGQATGTAYAHPQYDDNAFFLHDLGVVVLDKAWKSKTYGKLPALGQNTAYSKANPGSSAVYTAVGYGLQQINPAFVTQERVRMFANPWRIQIDDGIVGDFSILLSNNASSGGTCFGDSGGPNFIGSSNVIGGVTSFALNGTCGGTGGVYRVDQPDDLDWLATFGF
ncbi:MAG: trypsin-like serine protease [Chloroflexi bacterium]|nr:trypsin-like serine protease [Chloroflexota bacterium]